MNRRERSEHTIGSIGVHAFKNEREAAEYKRLLFLLGEGENLSSYSLKKLSHGLARSITSSSLRLNKKRSLLSMLKKCSSQSDYIEFVYLDLEAIKEGSFYDKADK